MKTLRTIQTGWHRAAVASLRFRSAVAAVLLLWMSPVYAMPTITVAPGTASSDYLPLTAFGIAPVAGQTDESMTNFNVPTFVFGGHSWGRVGVSGNGYVVVGGGTAADNSPVNQSLPDGNAPNHILAPFWTDLNIELGGELRVGILTNGVKTWAVFDWADVSNADGSGVNTFELWMGVNGTEDVWFTYAGVTAGSADLLTIGAEDRTGTVGAMAYFNGLGSLPGVGGILRVTTADFPVLTEVPEPSSLALLFLGLAGVAASRRRR